MVSCKTSDENFIVFIINSNRNADNFSKFCHYSSSFSIKICSRNIFFSLSCSFFVPKFLFGFRKFCKITDLRNGFYIQKKHFFYGNIFNHVCWVLVFNFYPTCQPFFTGNDVERRITSLSSP